jgi:hypothetical protein
MTPAQGRRQRAALLRDIARDLKSKNRAKLVELRGRVRALRAEARASIAEAIARCRAGRRLPTLKTLAAELRAAKAAARSQCDVDLKAARAVKGAAARARAELAAEAKYQADIRRIERSQRRKLHEAKARRPGLARSRAHERRQESDDEVRSNIPPELVPLFEKVKRSIKGSDRKTRTEAFLEYAQESPGEEWEAIEDAADRAVAEMERRQAMPNPKKKKKRAKCSSMAEKRKQRARQRRRSKTRPPTAAERAEWEASKPNPRRRKRANPKRRKRSRPNPRPRFDELARIAARLVLHAKHPKDRATVTPGYWKTPRPARAAKLRSLARGSARQKRAAAALARVELAHEGPPRRKNGAGMTDAQAAAEYTRSHWGERGRRHVVRTGAPNPAHGTATKLGRLHSVTYETRKKGDREATLYEHEFEGRRPTLVYNAGGLLIAGGDYEISEHGIEG